MTTTIAPAPDRTRLTPRQLALAAVGREFTPYLTPGQLRGLPFFQPLLTELADAIQAARDCPHYFVKEGGRWVCTMCGASR